MRPAPIELEHLTVQHDVGCLLWHGSKPAEEATFTLIRCRQNDRVLRDYFLGVAEAVLPMLGPHPSQGRVRETVDALAELFRSLMMPARKSVQGLWAELFLIVDATDARALAAAWHGEPEEQYDFSLSQHRIEVKSAAGGERRHYFTLEQLHPPAGTTALIASLFVEGSGGGISIAELMDRARWRVASDPDLQLRIDQLVAASLGQNWRNGLEQRFDWQRAQESLMFFEAHSVPSLTSDVPPGVSDVRFRSELAGVPFVELDRLREAGGLFQAAVPLRSAEHI